jgi:hypothetical protein
MCHHVFLVSQVCNLAEAIWGSLNTFAFRVQGGLLINLLHRSASHLRVMQMLSTCLVTVSQKQQACVLGLALLGNILLRVAAVTHSGMLWLGDVTSYPLHQQLVIFCAHVALGDSGWLRSHGVKNIRHQGQLGSIGGSTLAAESGVA